MVPPFKAVTQGVVILSTLGSRNLQIFVIKNPSNQRFGKLLEDLGGEASDYIVSNLGQNVTPI